MTDGDKTSTAEKRFSGEALVAISTAAAALVTTVGALATTGALQEMQRDHGILVIFAFAFVLIGASIWAVLAVTKPKATESSREAVAASAEMLGWLERLRDAKGASRFSAEERLSEVVNSLPVTGAQRLFSEHELDLRKSLGEAKGDDDKTLSIAKKMQAAPTPSAAAIPATAVPYIEAIRQAHDSAKLPYAEKLLDLIAPSKGRRFWQWLSGRFASEQLLATLAVSAFAVGIGVGVWAMVETQRAQDRPSMVASFDPEKLVLEGTAKAHNVGVDGRMLTEIIGLIPIEGEQHKFSVEIRYFANSGPDSDGVATQSFKYQFSADKKYAAVAVGATMSNQPLCANEAGKSDTGRPTVTIPQDQSKLPGCAFFWLPSSSP